MKILDQQEYFVRKKNLMQFVRIGSAWALLHLLLASEIFLESQKVYVKVNSN